MRHPDSRRAQIPLSPVWLLLMILGSPSLAAAQGPPVELQVSGQVRVRSEADGRSPATDQDFVSLLRTRLGVVAERGEQMRAVIRLSDSRVFGEESNTLTDASADRFDLQEGYLEWRSNGGTRLRVGRQGWAYGDERLIGTVGWANVTRAFDGVQLQLPVGSWNVDGFAATLREFDDVVATGVHPRSNEGLAEDHGLFGAWATNGDFDLYAIAETRVEGSGVHDAFRRTVGGNARVDLGGLALSVGGATQFGHQVNGSDQPQDISAWFGTVSLAHQFSGESRARLAVQVDALSGDADPTDSEDGAFNTLYGTNHKFYGFMDLVLDPAGQLSRRGLIDAMIRGSVMAGGWRLSLDAHRFVLAEEASPGVDKKLGTEFDATAARSLAPGLGLVTGASIFKPGDSGTHPLIGFDDDTHWWGYVQLTATF